MLEKDERWSKSLFHGLRDEGLNLEGMRSNNTNDVIKITNEDVSVEVKFWNSAIACYIVGARPPYHVICTFARRIWGRYNIDRIAVRPNGIFLIRFKYIVDRLKALELENVMFDKRHVVVKEWTVDLNLDCVNTDLVPIWVQLPGLNIKYWGANTLMKLTSRIGKPIKTDKKTARKERFDAARIMVEVKFGAELPDRIEFENENGVLTTQSIVYEWRPVKCDEFGGIGHGGEACRKKKAEIQGAFSST
ncbi:uncharacterized protein LOC104889110 [Beta vulgaris subsp. vulgaris]|uniref:uncharacterized protein LOC104889110 n=1 Tax=Beta vulgaris subsp. vulgaris TaxID=3555 RepID=UPI002036988D|nr:uncharacterized protein LOC104889110 [Beta vulgaris subsp. vulgaris]